MACLGLVSHIDTGNCSISLLGEGKSVYVSEFACGCVCAWQLDAEDDRKLDKMDERNEDERSLYAERV